MICPELGVTPLVDPGTDVEDERTTPVGSPSPVVDGVLPLSAPSGVDMELVYVFQVVGVLPAMVTPVVDPDGGSAMTPARYTVPPIPELSVLCRIPWMRLLLLGRQWGVQRETIPVGPDVAFWIGSSGVFVSDVAGVTVHARCQSVIGIGSMDQYLPWSSSPPMGESADSHLLPAPLTPRRMVAGQFASGSGVSSPTEETDVAGGHPKMPDMSRRAPLTFFRTVRMLELRHGCLIPHDIV